MQNQLEQTLDSREVAEMIGKEHHKLLRDIRRYIEQFNESNIGFVNNECKIAPVEFFRESTYEDNKGETRPCYRITKKGCEFIAHKMTGTKGTGLMWVKKFLTFCTRRNIFIARAESEVIR